MFSLLEKSKLQFYKILTLILFLFGVFMINSACNLIFYQPKESDSLKRFCKK